MHIKTVLAVSALLLTAGAHADDAATRYVRYVLGDTLLPRYQQLEQDNLRLGSSLAQACVAPGNATLAAAARQQWLQSYRSWMAVAPLNWGPSAELRSQRTIAFKPVRTTLVDSAVKRSAAGEADVFDTTGAAAKGYSAIEYLLYQPGMTLGSAGVCQWLQQTAADISTHSHELNRQWQRFAERINRGETAEDLPSTEQALEQIINLTLAGSNEMHKELSRLTQQKPEVISGQRSQSGKQLTQMQFSLLQQVLVGRKADDFALDKLLLARGKDPAIARQLQQRVAEVNKGLALLPDNLASVGHSGKEKPVVKALADLLTLIEGPVADGLDITLSFNESDGD